MVTFFIDQCFYSTPTKQSSPFMKVDDFGSNLLTVFDTVSFGLINLTVVGNGSHQFLSITERGVMPCAEQ